MAENPLSPAPPEIEQLRIKYAFWLAIIGLSIAAILVMFLVYRGWSEAERVVAVVGLFTSVLGTLVGAFFGMQIGAAGKEKDQQARQNAESLARKALSALPPESAQRITDSM